MLFSWQSNIAGAIATRWRAFLNSEYGTNHIISLELPYGPPQPKRLAP